MSFSRWGCEGSDVYTFWGEGSTQGVMREGFVCCGCWLGSGDSFVVDTADELIEHLKAHRAAGHVVPDSCFRQVDEARDWPTTGVTL